MTMRDPNEWAARIIFQSPLSEPFDEDFFGRLIREAQEDGARHATCPHCGPGTDLNTALNQLGDERIAVGWAKESITRLEAQVAALTERAERAEITNPIDSLPATPETVGMPQAGDYVRCCQCRSRMVIYDYVAVAVAKHGLFVDCDWCGSYDVEKVKP